MSRDELGLNGQKAWRVVSDMKQVGNSIVLFCIIHLQIQGGEFQSDICMHVNEFGKISGNHFWLSLTFRRQVKLTETEVPDMYYSAFLFDAGGTILACLVALERGLACSTAGGTHHAGPDYGSGYCLINDLAVASLFLSQHAIPGLRILIIDLDVHQVGCSTIFTILGPKFHIAVYCCTQVP